MTSLATIVVFWHSILIPIFLALLLLSIAYGSHLWPILIPYAIYYLTDNSYENGNVVNRSSKLVRGLPIWRWFASYFPITLHRTQPLDPKYKYIFCYHPHGVVAMGAMGAFATEGARWLELFPEIPVLLLTLETQFKVPLHRDYLLLLGISSVAKKNIQSTLSRGTSVCIVIGGARESLLARPGSAKLILKLRKGFVKIALTTPGVRLVPVFAFGENDIYEILEPKQTSILHKFQLGLKRCFGFTIPFFHARGVFNYEYGLMPYRKPIDVVIGKPIEVPHIEKPSQEDIDKYHEIYIEALKQLYDENQSKFGTEIVLDICD